MEGLVKTTWSRFLNGPAQTYSSVQATHSLCGEGTVPTVGLRIRLVCGLTLYTSEETGTLETESDGLLALSGSWLFASVVLKGLLRLVSSQGCHQVPDW